MEKRSFQRAHLALIIAFGLCGFGRAALSYDVHALNVTEERSGIAMQCALPLRTMPTSGFVPIHFLIGNRTNEAHTWQVSFRVGGMGYRQLGMSYATALTVGAGETREWDLLIPCAGLESRETGYSNIEGNIEGYAIKRSRFPLPTNYSSRYQSTTFTVISETLGAAAWSKIESELKTTTNTPTVEHPDLISRRQWRSYPRGSREFLGSQVKLSELPPDWRAFSGFSSLWLSIGDWEGLSSDRRLAIRHWIAAGGHLFVASPGDSLERLRLLPANLVAGKKQPLGFGAIHAVKLQNGELSPQQTAQEILALDDAPLPAWQEDYHNDWRLAELIGWPTLNVPVLIGFVSLFAIVVGPLNLRLFAPRNRRSRLFFTVPLLSAGASVALFGVIAIGDGFGGTGGRNVLLYLPAGENQMTLLQEQIARSRLLFGRAFKMPETVQVAFVQQAGQNDRALSFERAGDILSGDWFRSRTVQAQFLRASIPSRAEVTLQPSASPDAPPVLLSSVAAPLRNVYFIDAAGRYWKTARLETGRPATLEPSTREALSVWMTEGYSKLSPNLSAVLNDAVHRPGHFYAEAEGMPEAPLDTLTAINWNEQKVLCFGTCTGGDNK